MLNKAGRPRLASQQLLQEAAFELFQLQGYRSTSVEQIAKTAGFSRATFFNFFSSKAELFWVETDELISTLKEGLEIALAHPEPLGLDAVLREHVSHFSSVNIPWALQNFRLIEAADDLVASGSGRVLELNQLFLNYLRRSGGQPFEVSLSMRTEAAERTAQLLTALVAWVEAGVHRRDLGFYLDQTL